MDPNSREQFSHPAGISPPPNLKTEKTERDYIPQIHADERQGYIDCKFNEEATQEDKPQGESKSQQPIQKEGVKSPDNDKKLVQSKEKKAIKLITVPQEKEPVQKPERNLNESPNPQEFDSPSIDMRNQNLVEEQKDSACLSPNSKLPTVRKKSILKGSPNLLGDGSHRFDAEGNAIGEGKGHRISFRADLYQINEVERFKNENEVSQNLQK